MWPRLRPRMNGNTDCRDRHKVEYVHVELVAHDVHRRRLDRSLHTIAGVVDQDIDRSEPFLDAADGRARIAVVTHVQQDAVRSLGSQALEEAQVLGPPKRSDDPVALRKHSLGQRAAEPTARSRDEPLLHPNLLVLLTTEDRS
jgi:hypothetical protein